MAIKIIGSISGVVAGAETKFKTLRITARAIGYGENGFFRIGAVSGTMAAAIGANAEIFQFRWAPILVPNAIAVLYKLGMSAGANVAATAAGAVRFLLYPARSWTAAGSGGTRIDMTADNGKLSKLMVLSSMANDIGIATTAALTAGTKTLDTTAIAAVSADITTAAITVSAPFTFINSRDGMFLDSYANGGYPLIMSPSEGYVIRVDTGFPATLTWNFSVQAAWAEAMEF